MYRQNNVALTEKIRPPLCEIIHSALGIQISEEQCLKRIPDLVRSRTVLLKLGSDNSCPTIGFK